MKHLGITKVIRVHHLENMNHCTKLCANPSNVKIFYGMNEYFDLLMVLIEKSEDYQHIRIHSLGTMDITFHGNPSNGAVSL